MKIRVLILIFSAAMFLGCLFNGSSKSNAEWVLQKIDGDGLVSVHFPVPDTGYAAGLSAIIFKTVNGGKTWIKQNEEGASQSLYQVHFVNVGVGYAVGDYGHFLRTLNGGENWTPIEDSLWGDLNELDYMMLTSVFLSMIRVTSF